MSKLTLPYILSVSILALIGGCAPTSKMQSLPTYPNFSEHLETELSATELSARDRAVKILAALDLEPMHPTADSLRLKAAQLFSDHGDFQDSLDSLEAINYQNLNDPQFIDWSLLAAANALALFDPNAGAVYLNRPRFKSLIASANSALRLRELDLQSQVHFAQGNYNLGLEALIDSAKIARRRVDIRIIHNQIWDRISRLPYQHLATYGDQPHSILAGWLQLGAAIRNSQADPAGQAYAYAEWRQDWRSHPAAKLSPTGINRSRRIFSPQQVAFLLPLQEAYKTPSYTLIDGFMEAYYQALPNTADHNNSAAKIRIYDTSNQAIQNVYNRAVGEGADLIIGPMRQSEVEALASVPVLPVPTLSLNRLDREQVSATENLYQFGLSPLDELVQIADRAWNRDLQSILLIAPDNAWGLHAADFFGDYWQKKGGNPIEAVRYLPSDNDFTQLLKPALHIDQSEQRGLYIKRFINSSITFTARRRQDIDLVVMLGYPLKARQIKPALDFLYAGDVPVMATSHLYNGDPQVELDRDLSEIEFTSMPWTLSGHLSSELNLDSQLHTAYRHLFATGYDTFQLYRNLQRLQSDQTPPIYGATGLLSLRGNIVVREAKWAKFERGAVMEIHH
ncbi:MAG: penicillin-binding protein activator [Porticoccaceae bacterium]